MLELYFLRCYQSSCHTHQNDLGIVLALLELFFKLFLSQKSVFFG